MKTVQQVLFLYTRSDSLRAEIIGRGGEDPRGLKLDQPVWKHNGLLFSKEMCKYKTVLHALADSWKLLGFHQANKECTDMSPSWWEWVLVRDVSVEGY